jgi:hypothetical protein
MPGSTFVGRVLNWNCLKSLSALDREELSNCKGHKRFGPFKVFESQRPYCYGAQAAR